MSYNDSFSERLLENEMRFNDKLSSLIPEHHGRCLSILVIKIVVDGLALTHYRAAGDGRVSLEAVRFNSQSARSPALSPRHAHSSSSANKVSEPSGASAPQDAQMRTIDQSFAAGTPHYQLTDPASTRRQASRSRSTSPARRRTWSRPSGSARRGSATRARRASSSSRRSAAPRPAPRPTPVSRPASRRTCSSSARRHTL